MQHIERSVVALVALTIKALIWKGVAAIDPFLAAFLLFGLTSIFELLNSRNFASSLASGGAIVALLAAGWNKYNELRLKNHVGENRMLREQVDHLKTVADDNSRIADENRRLIEHLEAERIKLNFDVAQLSAEFLRVRGVIHSGDRRRLRPAVEAGNADVLLVEDDAEMCRAAERVLRHHGLRVETARSIGEALALVRSREDQGRQFDFVILDIVLPDGNGLEILDELRRLKLPTSAIVWTGHCEDAVLGSAHDRGASAVLVKPVEFDELMALLGVAPPRGTPLGDA